MTSSLDKFPGHILTVKKTTMPATFTVHGEMYPHYFTFEPLVDMEELTDALSSVCRPVILLQVQPMQNKCSCVPSSPGTVSGIKSWQALACV